MVDKETLPTSPTPLESLSRPVPPSSPEPGENPEAAEDLDIIEDPGAAGFSELNVESAPAFPPAWIS